MNARLLGSLISLGIYGTYFAAKYTILAVEKKRIEKEAKLRAMDAEAIDVEWKVVEES